MKKFLKSCLIGLGLFLLSNNVYAESDTACAIILCAPAGFPSSDCSAPYSEMMNRIKHFESPVPSLGSCMIKAESSHIDMVANDVKTGDATLYEKVTRCMYLVTYGKNNNTTCKESITIPSHYVYGAKLELSSSSMKNHFNTNFQYIDVKADNNRVGDIYFVNNYGIKTEQLPYISVDKFRALHKFGSYLTIQERANMREYVRLINESRGQPLWIDEDNIDLNKIRDEDLSKYQSMAKDNEAYKDTNIKTDLKVDKDAQKKIDVNKVQENNSKYDLNDMQKEYDEFDLDGYFEKLQ